MASKPPTRKRKRQRRPSPHDAYMKRLLGVPGNVARIIGDHLPEIAALIAPGSILPASGAFVSGRLKGAHADLLYSARLADPLPGGPSGVLLQVIIEDKSRADLLTPLQLHRYTANVWERWLRGPRKPHERPPPVISIVVHTGPKPWPHSPELIDMLGPLPAGRRPFLPSLRHVLIDLPGLPEDQLSGDPALNAKLRVARDIQRRDLASRLVPLLVAVLIIEDPVEIETILVYLESRLGPEPVTRAVDEIEANVGDDRMSATLEHLMSKGRARGKAEGRAEGKAETLLRQLTRRFGPLPRRTQERIAAADLATLDRWLDRLLDAPELKSVLDGD